MSIITIAVFTASVTSALTTRQIRGLVNGSEDLPRARVGAVSGSATTGFLDEERIRHRDFANAQDGFRALTSGSIDAFVYDKPLLAWTAEQQFPHQCQVLDTVFETQNYGMAMPAGSRYRKPIDVAILEAIHDEAWKETLFRYLGEKNDRRPTWFRLVSGAVQPPPSRLPVTRIGSMIDSGEFVRLCPIQRHSPRPLRLVRDQITKRRRILGELLIDEKRGLLGGIGLDLSRDGHSELLHGFGPSRSSRAWAQCPPPDNKRRAE